jgi:apolipoprotein N-acyltransferase
VKELGVNRPTYGPDPGAEAVHHASAVVEAERSAADGGIATLPGATSARPGRAGGRAGRLLPVAMALAGGLGLDSTFAPLGWWPMAVPAAALIMLAARGRSWRGGLLVGLVAGLAEFLPLLAWLHVVTPAAWLVLAVAESLYLAALGAGLSLLVGRVAGWPVWTACLWVSEELVRSRWPLGGFGWGRLAFSQPDTPFTGYAAIAGAPLVTFAVALSAGFLAATVLFLVRLRRDLPARSALALRAPAATLVAALGVPLLAMAVPRPTDGVPLQVAVVQGNVAHPGKHFLGRAEQVLDNHLAETATLAKGVASGSLAQPQVVLWPENASDVDPFNNPSAYAAIQAAARSVSAPILVGSVLDHGSDHLTNTGVVWDPVTGPGQRYTKRHLVPFGEYIPWRGVVSHLTTLTNLVPEDFVPGDTVGALDIGPTRLADVMCFEIAFDGVVRSGVTAGGRLIVVQTNNATYMGTAETRQQLAMSQLRAVEHGRSVVVTATSGISAIIAPDGHVVTRTAEMTPAIIDEPVMTRTELTVADHLGVLPEWLIGILGVLAVLGTLAATRTSRTMSAVRRALPSRRPRPDGVPRRSA